MCNVFLVLTRRSCLVRASRLGQHRIGVLVLLIHDFADPWLEVAKMFNYAKVSACVCE